MQELSTYLLENHNASDEEITTRLVTITNSVTDWLSKKGAQNPKEKSGVFESRTAGQNGKFTREKFITEVGELEEIQLNECTSDGHIFTTKLSIIKTENKISIYTNLAFSNTESVIAPVHTDPRCPAIIRQILSLYPDWKLNGNLLGEGKPELYSGIEGAESLVELITSNERSIPIVVVSEIDGDVLWPRLDTELAFDLAGLARVIRIDDEASWALTDELGKLHSCYLGAVRLYWPIQQNNPDEKQYPGTVWTAYSLLSNDQDGKGLARFRSHFRKKLMSVAALTVVPPLEIRTIKTKVTRSRLEALEKKANANSEELEFARYCIKESERLEEELSRAKTEISTLSSRAEIAEYALDQYKSSSGSAEQVIIEETDAEIQPGEVRFYKKSHNKPGYDVLVRVADCGHSTWQNASKAEKAKKGVEKLEARNDWKNIQHCGTCTGGGMWKVKW